MKREPRSRKNAASASMTALALAVAFAACVTDSVGTVQCESGLRCPPRTVCIPTPVRKEMGFVTEYHCAPEGCGDGVPDPPSGEVCDDGNRSDGDGCSADCRRLEFCGNERLDPGEACDATVTGYEDECSNDCRSTLTCGDGVVHAEHGEGCDEGVDGTRRATRTCDEDCSIPVCGDGILNPHFVNPATGRLEECDSFGMNTSECNADCTLPRCGDGLRNSAAGEACDGGAVDTPDCNEDCTLPVCGDGDVNEAAEACDVDEDTDTCNGPQAGPVACRVPFCGDGYPNAATDEACDEGIGGFPRDSAACNQHCTAAACGDGYVNAVAGEICDGGGDTATCNGPGVAQCRQSACGDGRVNTAAGEQCEPPSGTRRCNGFDTGAVACRWSVCGDGHLDDFAGEACDDGNDFAFDACPSGSLPDDDHPPGLCQPATCGDGFIWLGVEACDTGGDTATCNGPTADDARCQLPRCGDGHVNLEAGEECDIDDCSPGITCLPSGDPNECTCGN